MWALLVAVTGGFVIHLHSIRLASRSPLHGLLLAILGRRSGLGPVNA